MSASPPPATAVDTHAKHEKRTHPYPPPRHRRQLDFEGQRCTAHMFHRVCWLERGGRRERGASWQVPPTGSGGSGVRCKWLTARQWPTLQASTAGSPSLNDPRTQQPRPPSLRALSRCCSTRTQWLLARPHNNSNSNESGSPCLLSNSGGIVDRLCMRRMEFDSTLDSVPWDFTTTPSQ